MTSIDSNPIQPQSPLEKAKDRGLGTDNESTSVLPGPRVFPNADVVIYDGQCVFCTKQVSNLLRLDGKNRLAFVSLHDEFVAEQFPDLGFDQLMKQIYLIPSAGEAGYSSKRLGGAAAVRHLTCRLPKLWIMAPLMHIPFTMPFWQWGYMQIANRRYKIAGKSEPQCDENGTCDLHFKD